MENSKCICLFWSSLITVIEKLSKDILLRKQPSCIFYMHRTKDYLMWSKAATLLNATHWAQTSKSKFCSSCAWLFTAQLTLYSRWLIVSWDWVYAIKWHVHISIRRKNHTNKFGARFSGISIPFPLSKVGKMSHIFAIPFLTLPPFLVFLSWSLHFPFPNALVPVLLHCNHHLWELQGKAQLKTKNGGKHITGFSHMVAKAGYVHWSCKSDFFQSLTVISIGWQSSWGANLGLLS